MVKFNSRNEFLEELGRDADKVERHIVRLTYLRKVSSVSPDITYLFIVGTARVEGELYRLERYCGDLWEIEGRDKPILDTAEACCKALEEGCAALGLETRPGVFE